MKSKFYINLKITLLLFISFLGFNMDAQYYAFTKSTGTYTEITGGTTLINTNWDYFSVKFKTPFNFKFFTLYIFDSIELTDWASIYFNNINNGYFDIYNVDLNSRGNGKSPVSYKTEGNAPNRILKMQFHNAGFAADGPNFIDSVNLQVWVYETTFIIEYRYGPNSVKSSSYGGGIGPTVQIADPLSVIFNFIVLEGNPSNPTVRTVDMSFAGTLDGSPPNGTIYRFTPSAFHTGIQENKGVKINVIQNRISLPENLEVNQINIMNMNGQIIQSATEARDIDFSNFAHGVYVVTINTKEGLITQKLVL